MFQIHTLFGITCSYLLTRTFLFALLFYITYNFICWEYSSTYSLFLIYVCRQFSIWNENVITRNREYEIEWSVPWEREQFKLAAHSANQQQQRVLWKFCILKIHIKLVCVRVRARVRMCVIRLAFVIVAPIAHRVCFICSNFSQYLFTYLHFEFAFDMVRFFGFLLLWVTECFQFGPFYYF